MNIGKRPNPEFSIKAFQQGQASAFNIVFNRYYPALCFFAARLTQNQLAAEDITQESFVKLWEKHAGFESADAIKAFLYISVRNACFNFVKRSQTAIKNQKVWSQVWDEAEDYVLNQMTYSEMLRELNFYLDNLPPECGKIMRLSYIEGLTNQEIANLLSISIHTVKNQKARAIYLIRKKLSNKPLLLMMFLITVQQMANTERWILS